MSDDPAQPAPSPGPRPWRRWLIGAGSALVLLLAVIGVGAYAVLHLVDLTGFAASRASAALGRHVGIDSLHVAPGRWLSLQIDGLTVPGLPGGPALITLRHATAEVDALSLLHGPMVLRNVAADGVSVLLERAPDRTPNWRFGPQDAGNRRADRATFPSLRGVRLSDVDVVFLTTSGHRLVTHLDQASVGAADDDRPVLLTAAGAYNGVPVSLDAVLGSLAAYRQAGPFATSVHLVSGDVALTFDGTMTDPLNVDGMKGRLVLDAESPGPILAMAGVKSGIDASLHLTGDCVRQADVWTLTDAFGALNDDSITSATLRLTEGDGGRPDAVQADVTFDRLDLNGLLGAGPPGKRSGANMKLAVDKAPDTLIDARLAAREVAYDDDVLSDVVVKVSQSVGKVALQELKLTIFGIRIAGTGGVAADGDQGRVTADLVATGGDVQALRRRLGLAAVPLTGRLDGQFAVQATGAGLNEAIRGARISAIVALHGGSIAKEVIEMASTDIRALFRVNRGMTPVSCLLMGVDIRAGIGTLSPLRVRAAEGTIAGSARFDLNRRVLDLTIGSEAHTTGLFALDIPVRVSGSFANPDVRPARWTPQGRALLAAADDLASLPPALQAMARRNPCPPSGR